MKVTVGFEITVNVGNYENVKPSISIEREFDDDIATDKLDTEILLMENYLLDKLDQQVSLLHKVVEDYHKV